MDDSISRQAAIDLAMQYCPDDDGTCSKAGEDIRNLLDELEELPSAQPERLTDDDFETIRIHLNAYKEKLCNQHRWKEAEEYQKIIDRFMSFASAQPEIVRCWECAYRRRCMLQHFVESNAVDGAKIDWSEWYCADGVRDITVPSKSDERLEE